MRMIHVHLRLPELYAATFLPVAIEVAVAETAHCSDILASLPQSFLSHIQSSQISQMDSLSYLFHQTSLRFAKAWSFDTSGEKREVPMASMASDTAPTATLAEIIAPLWHLGGSLHIEVEMYAMARL